MAWAFFLNSLPRFMLLICLFAAAEALLAAAYSGGDYCWAWSTTMP
jgi:hypothetical protein